MDDWAGVPAALEQARQVDPKVLVEQGARGREIDVAVLQHPDGRVQAGPPLEIRVTGADFFDYDAKYDGGAIFQIPARLDAATTEVLQDRAIRAFQRPRLPWAAAGRLLPAREGSPEPVVNEVNTFPGFTAASQFPQIWQTAGIGFAALIDILIAGALADQDRATTAGCPAGHERSPPGVSRRLGARSPDRARPRRSGAVGPDDGDRWRRLFAALTCAAASTIVQMIWSAACADNACAAMFVRTVRPPADRPPPSP